VVIVPANICRSWPREHPEIRRDIWHAGIQNEFGIPALNRLDKTLPERLERGVL
jgi:hypothetical protein